MNLAKLKKDIPASIVVFLVSVPLCLGVAVASGAPLSAGIISGIAGGILVGFISRSHTSISRPAAGLTTIVFASITQLGSFEIFLTALILAGIIQIVAGFLKAGIIANYFPSNVIKGLLNIITWLNIKNSMTEIIEQSNFLKSKIANKEVGIVGAYYHTDTGKVDFAESDTHSPTLIHIKGVNHSQIF